MSVFRDGYLTFTRGTTRIEPAVVPGSPLRDRARISCTVPYA